MKMYRQLSLSLRNWFFFIGLLTSFASFGQYATDYVILTNGDVVSGKITQMNDTAVFMTSPILGDFVIKKSEVESITLNTTQNPKDKNLTPVVRPNYQMPLWHRTLGVSFNSIGSNLEIGRRLESTRFNAYIKSGLQYLPNYSITTIPVELGLGLHFDTTKKSDFVLLHGGYSFLLAHDNWNNWYEPGMVYGCDYRHVFVNRRDARHGTYLEFGYEGGVLKRDFPDWWWSQTEGERVVHRSRFRLGAGIVF